MAIAYRFFSPPISTILLCININPSLSSTALNLPNLPLIVVNFRFVRFKHSLVSSIRALVSGSNVTVSSVLVIRPISSSRVRSCASRGGCERDRFSIAGCVWEWELSAAWCTSCFSEFWSAVAFGPIFGAAFDALFNAASDAAFGGEEEDIDKQCRKQRAYLCYVEQVDALQRVMLPLRGSKAVRIKNRYPKRK